MKRDSAGKPLNVLMQHGDMSGTWTAEQKDMIKQMA